MGKSGSQSPQDLSRMVASVERLARIRDYLRDSRDVSGTVTQLTDLIDEARRASGQYTAQTPPVSAPSTATPPVSAPSTATARVNAVERKNVSDAEKYTRLGVDVLHAGGTIALSAFGLGGVAPAIGSLEQTALGIGFNS